MSLFFFNFLEDSFLAGGYSMLEIGFTLSNSRLKFNVLPRFSLGDLFPLISLEGEELEVVVALMKS